MGKALLEGCRILVVEDEYFMAQDLSSELEKVGAVVIGPEGSVANALARITSEPRIDAAVLDMNLGDEAVFPVAEVLSARGVPFLFASGYDDPSFKNQFKDIPNCLKPLNTREVLALLHKIAGAT